MSVLTVSDIESLGWKHLKVGWYDLVSVPGRLPYWNYVRLRTWAGSEVFIQGYKGDPSVYPDVESERLFDGEIESKEELELLMKMTRLTESKK